MSFCNIMFGQSQNAEENVNKIFRETKNDLTERNLGPSTETKKKHTRLSAIEFHYLIFLLAALTIFQHVG